MPRELAGRFARWFEYDRDAHEKVLRSLESVRTDRLARPEFERGVAVLVRAAGGEPAVSDLIYWCPESVPAVPPSEEPS
jgi:hypothetical protein